MNSLTPNLMVEDVRAAVDYYEQLGFDVQMAVPEGEGEIHSELALGERYVYAQISSGAVELMLQDAESLRSDVSALMDVDIGSSCTLYVEVDNVEAMYESVAEDVDVVQDLDVTWYGMREFYVRDPNGYVLGFAAEAV